MQNASDTQVSPRHNRTTVLVCAVVSIFCVLFVFANAASAKPLDAETCAALKQEHETLADPNMAADLKKGADWAKANLGQLRLQKIERLFTVEEQLAFRCRGVAVAEALVIPTLKTAVTPPPLSVARRQGSGLRVSTVPPPVRRPARTSVAKTATSVTATTSAKPNATVVKSVPTPQPGPAAKDKSKLPKVIRLQTGADGAAAPAKAKKKKVNVKRVLKKRRKRVKRQDAYVPPPPNPSYQPSLRVR